ncbi:unnamed protein product [Lactuca saligna]|uniref:Uncharacterized protein n=1 Tax=Lactuca saligna TaxID=75948 RepID=A0AA36EM01_LACSI|nr:unnamed protein product [Lactuca saligna]
MGRKRSSLNHGGSISGGSTRPKKQRGKQRSWLVVSVGAARSCSSSFSAACFSCGREEARRGLIGSNSFAGWALVVFARREEGKDLRGLLSRDLAGNQHHLQWFLTRDEEADDAAQGKREGWRWSQGWQVMVGLGVVRLIFIEREEERTIQKRRKQKMGCGPIDFAKYTSTTPPLEVFLAGTMKKKKKVDGLLVFWCFTDSLN